MDGAHHPFVVAAHAAAIDERTPGDDDRLARVLMRRVWPRGVEDRFDRVAVAWLRYWGPQVGWQQAEAPCTCDVGRCPLCN